MKFTRIINQIKPLFKSSLIHSKDVLIIGCLILIFITRILSNSDENEVTVGLTKPTDEAINVTVQTESTFVSTTEYMPVTETDMEKNDDTVKKTVTEPFKSTVESTDETKLAYSPELDKTYTISEFSKLTKDELMTFPGIGEVTAQRILDYIAEFGPFQTFDEIMEVKGIGEKKLQKLLTIFP